MAQEQFVSGEIMELAVTPAIKPIAHIEVRKREGYAHGHVVQASWFCKDTLEVYELLDALRRLFPPPKQKERL
jgi:hypothetical protein